MNREEKKKETAQRIIQAALTLFSEKGYEETTVAEIAEAAKIAKGTFFNYFTSKENVLIKIQKALFFNEISSLKDKEGPYSPRLLALVKQMGDSMGENHALVRASLQRFLSSTVLEHSRQNILSNRESLTEIFSKGQQSGEFTTAIPAPVMAHTALQIYLGALVSWGTGVEENESLGDRLLLSFQVFFTGILHK